MFPRTYFEMAILIRVNLGHGVVQANTTGSDG